MSDTPPLDDSKRLYFEDLVIDKAKSPNSLPSLTATVGVTGWDGQRSGLRWAEYSFMMSCSLMILFKINSIGIAILEFKSDAPGTIHMHTVARGPLTLELVKIKAWQIHLFGPLDGIETIKTQ
ncbi:hypothetical protein [Nitrosococcus halophilus]|uniref:hypothetical protein n=1 Tax=Nitrosococcus halophilus TaxID=133539 RepID=UPI00193D952D|nr:hypothetical protein [Nitrosococcus halophilus]